MEQTLQKILSVLQGLEVEIIWHLQVLSITQTLLLGIVIVGFIWRFFYHGPFQS